MHIESGWLVTINFHDRHQPSFGTLAQHWRNAKRQFLSNITRRTQWIHAIVFDLQTAHMLAHFTHQQTSAAYLIVSQNSSPRCASTTLVHRNFKIYQPLRCLQTCKMLLDPSTDIDIAFNKQQLSYKCTPWTVHQKYCQGWMGTCGFEYW